jgi:hypothetical protein
MIAFALGALALLAVLGIIYSAARSAVRRHGAAPLLWRWLTGHHLDGEYRTDAGWLIGGTRVFTKTGRASRWAHKPRAYRAAVRGGGTVIALAAGGGMLVAPGLTLGALAGFGVLLVALGAWQAYDAARTWRHVRRWVRPLHLALGRALGQPLGVSPRSWLDVPRDYAGREGAAITVRLPEGFNNTGDDSKRLVREIVATKLALENPSANWRLAGRNPSVTFTVAVPPPPRVTYGDVRELIARAKPAAPLAGLGRGRKPVYVDFDQDSPHAIFSMSSGTGKSVVLRTLVAQELHRGAVALVLDIKRLSHAWARGLPNVRYCRDIAEIHEALLWLGAETDKRNRLADEGSDIDGNTDHVDVGPRIIVVAEELNATSVRLAAYWRQVKDKDDPASSPAIEAMGDVFFMGRQVKVNILGVAQMFTARTVGGPEARENAGVRVLGGYTLNNWRMLVPEIWPAPKKSRVKGRVQVCVGGTAHETQIAFLTPAEARELATAGQVALFPGQSQSGDGESAAAPVRLHVAGHAAPIGLRQAIADGVIPVPAGSTPDRTLANVRKARQYDPEFPEARGGGDRGAELVYDPDELASWSRNRPKAAAG